MSTFYSGLQVKYKEQIGFVDFVGEKYLTFCVQTFEDRSRSVCLLIYRDQWKEIQLIKESEK